VVVLLAFTTVNFLYSDVKATIEHSFNFIDSILQGRPLDFYQIAIDNSTFGHPAVYDFPLYAIFAVWNLPIYIIHHITGIDYLYSFGCLLWSKLMIVAFTLLAAWALNRLAKTIGLDKGRRRWVVLLFLTASTVIIPVFIIAQYDIIGIAFMLLGIDAYLRGKTKSFLVWFAIANTMKLFSLFLFVPLVLLRTKKLWPIIGQGIVGIAGVAICKLVYGSQPAYQASTGGFMDGMLSRLTATGFKWEYDQVVLPLFVIVILLTCLFAYVRKSEDGKDLARLSIYLAFIVWAAFVALVPLNPYWMILVAPFAILMPFLNSRHLSLNLILETAMGGALVWISACMSWWVFGTGTTQAMLPGVVHPVTYGQRYPALRDLIIRVAGSDHLQIISAILVTSVIGMSVLMYPRRSDVSDTFNEEHVSRALVWLRGAVPALVAVAMLFIYLFPAQTPILDTRNGTLVNASADLLQQGTSVEQTLEIQQTITVTRVIIGFTAEGFDWINSSMVEVSIIDPSTQTTMWATTRSVNSFEGEFVTFDVSGVQMDQGKSYLLRITGSSGEGVPLYVQLNQDIDQFPTMVNGRQVSGDVALAVFGR